MIPNEPKTNAMRLVFWNCGVAPTKGTRSEERAAAVRGVVQEIVQRRPAVIALCEADAELIVGLKAALDLETHDYRERVLNGPQGRSRWDLALLFDRDQVEILQERPVIARNDGLVLRASYCMSIMVPKDELLFELFLAHWPSRLRRIGDDNRQYCAQALWEAIEESLRSGNRVVVLGDFNEEPHDEIICDVLRASRDPEIVSCYPEQRLYNPSWWLASPILGDAWADFGTMHYQESGLGTRWHALDQALTCHQWLDRAGRWAPEVRALRSPLATVTITSRKIFDHVPIELTLTR
jgi:hypothetical protein